MYGDLSENWTREWTLYHPVNFQKILNIYREKKFRSSITIFKHQNHLLVTHLFSYLFNIG